MAGAHVNYFHICPQQFPSGYVGRNTFKGLSLLSVISFGRYRCIEYLLLDKGEICRTLIHRSRLTKYAISEHGTTSTRNIGSGLVVGEPFGIHVEAVVYSLNRGKRDSLKSDLRTEL